MSLWMIDLPATWLPFCLGITPNEDTGAGAYILMCNMESLHNFMQFVLFNTDVYFSACTVLLDNYINTQVQFQSLTVLVNEFETSTYIIFVVND